MNDLAHEYFKAVYIERGFVSSDKEIVDAYNAGLAADRWISVGDRLPELLFNNVSDWVLIHGGNIKHGSLGRINLGIWDCLYGRDVIVVEGVTHWQPLPEPPK